MPSEAIRKEWLKKAEQLYGEVESLSGLAQVEAVRQKLDAMADENERSSVEMLVWYWLGHGKEPISSPEWLTANRMLAATFVACFLIGWVELGYPRSGPAPLRWSRPSW